MIVISYLGKLLLQIRTRSNCGMKNEPLYCNIQIVFQTKGKLIDFFTVQCSISVFCLTLLLNLGAVAVMQPIMAKLRVILKSK